jgi:hypothetical protein
MAKLTLQSVVKMILQVGADHLRKVKTIDKIPLWAMYNFRLCHHLLGSLNNQIHDVPENLRQDLGVLLERLQARWLTKVD